MRDQARNPERAVSLHLARSGSQSERAIWFILPAHGASHIIRKYITCCRTLLTRFFMSTLFWISTVRPSGPAIKEATTVSSSWQGTADIKAISTAYWANMVKRKEIQSFRIRRTPTKAGNPGHNSWDILNFLVYSIWHTKQLLLREENLDITAFPTPENVGWGRRPSWPFQLQLFLSTIGALQRVRNSSTNQRNWRFVNIPSKHTRTVFPYTIHMRNRQLWTFCKVFQKSYRQLCLLVKWSIYISTALTRNWINSHHMNNVRKSNTHLLHLKRKKLP